jgi:hypothetical protein
MTTVDQSISNKKVKISPSILAECYIEIARVAYRTNCIDIATTCYQKAITETQVELRVKVKLDLYRATVLSTTPVISITTDQDLTSIHRLQEKDVEVKQFANKFEALRILERILSISSSQLNDEALSIEICTSIWNTGLVFLQPHLRQYIYRVFTVAVNYLSSIDCCLLYQLRTQFHFEIAKVLYYYCMICYCILNNNLYDYSMKRVLTI